MKRRNFLQISGKLVSIPVLLNGMGVSAMARPSLFSSLNDDTGRVLVLIQMSGGNDGLNMVIPRDQYDRLAKLRSNILLPKNSIIPLTDETGFHPAMTGLKAIYDEGRLGIVQSVGYPNQNRSHFRSTDIWTSGSPADQYWRTGWFGRYLDGQFPGFPEAYPNETYTDPFAVTFGNTVSETCQGMAGNFSMTLLDPFSLSPLYEGQPTDVPDNYYGAELAFLRTTIAQTNAYANVITTAANAGNNLVDYPADNRLAQQLKNVARLISGGLKTKMYVVSLGGFDTHANQVNDGDTANGIHANLLETLSEAIAAFQRDLQALGLDDKVVGLTFSEFGRQIASNDAFGTDHGTAAPLIVFGSCVSPQILGANPEIPEQPQPQEGIAMMHDFRDVYGSILVDWFGIDETEISTLLYPGFRHLPLVNACTAVPARDKPKPAGEISFSAFPNPFKNWTTVSFTCGNEQVRLSVFDALGTEIRVLMDQRLSEGRHELRFEGHDLAPGPYFFRIQLKKGIKVQRTIKL